MPRAFNNSAEWRATRAQRTPRIAASPRDEIALEAPDWQPLRQSWRSDGLERTFQPGWARITWDPHHLFYEAFFRGASPANRARTLNERTWEFGDICEVFVEAAGGSGYVELHVTPENQRLQLLWRPRAFEKFSAGQTQLDAATVDDPNWVQSAVQLIETGWAIHAILPARILGVEELSPKLSLRTAVCRYDCGPGGEPVRLSSTAALTFPSYHRREEWHRLVLVTTSIRP